MKIIVKAEGHDYKYEIGEIAKLFFEPREVGFIENEDAGRDSCLCLCSSAELSAKGAIVKAKLTEDGKADREECSLVPGIDSLSNPGIEGKRKLKFELKRLAYLVLSAYTKVSPPWGMLTGIRPAKIVHELMSEGLGHGKVISKLTDYYMISEGKAETLWQVACTEKKILDASSPDTIAIYIGIPFCTSRCLYCSFTSNPIGKYKAYVRPYLEALKKEIRYTSEIIEKKGFKIESIYIGGGTPTSLDADMLDELLFSVKDSMDMSCLKEYTLEAGRPDTIDAKKLSAARKYDISRISINPQTMNDETLKLIGRNHTSQDIIDSFRLAREMGFDDINMDVIIGLPGETAGMFEKTLKAVSALEPESLTVHTMAVKRASRLNELIKSYTLTDAAEASRMAELSMEYASSMNLKPYYLYRQKNILGNLENIGYCRQGFESIYNIQIMEEKQAILALGAGGVSKLVYEGGRIERIFNVKSVEEYVQRIDEMLKRKDKILEDNIS